MKDLLGIEGRFPHPILKCIGDNKNWCFKIRIKNKNPRKPNSLVAVIASSDRGWEHVSVSLQNRTPTWREMDYIKRMFFNPDEVVIQIHPAESDHINVHNFCLHLWRSTDQDQPLPPTEMI